MTARSKTQAQTRTFRASLTGVGLLLLALALPVRAAEDCPPQAQMPTPQQLSSGLREARDRGLLWRLEKDGQVGWLYGTLHVGRPDWAFPGPTLIRALRAADTVALEIDPTDPALLQALQAFGAASDPAAEPLLTPDMAARLAALAQAACVQGPAFNNLHPVLQLTSLMVLSARRQGLDPAFGQEHALAGFAKTAGKRMVALETAQQQLAALLPADPRQARDMLDRGLTLLSNGQSGAMLLTLAEAWAQGDLQRLASYAQWCDCMHTDADRDQLRRVNDERNPAMADAITAQLAQGRRVFTAVGALHLTGPAALPLLMAQRGYRVQRIRFAPL